MNIKKYAMSAAAGLSMLAFVVPAAFAAQNTNVTNWSHVKLSVGTSSNTGSNKIGGKNVNGGFIGTGDATSIGDLGLAVGTTSVSHSGTGTMNTNITNGAHVYTTVNTSANTGYNNISGKNVNGGSIMPGSAGSQSTVSEAVNTTSVSF